MSLISLPYDPQFIIFEILHKQMTHLCYNITAFPAEKRFVKHFELQSQFSHVVRNTKTVCESCQPVDNIFIGVRDESLTEWMFAIEDKIDNASHTIFRQQCLLIQMDDPVIVVKYIHRVF